MICRALLACLICLAAGACAPRDRAQPESLEAALERERPGLTKVDLDMGEESCRGVGATAFKRGDEIVMLEYAIGTSTRWIILDFYYERGELRLAVQRTWWLLDDEACELEKPRLESETRFHFARGRLTKTEGDEPAVAAAEADLLSDSRRLLDLARTSR